MIRTETKRSYRTYLGSEHWQQRRKEFLAENNSCANCEMPRWLAEIAYDQDLNVHHVSYANKGDERDEDLESLCRRCHEIEKFGRSELREPKTAMCTICKCKHWNPYSYYCDVCSCLRSGKIMSIVRNFNYQGDCRQKVRLGSFIFYSLIMNFGSDSIFNALHEAKNKIEGTREGKA